MAAPAALCLVATRAHAQRDSEDQTARQVQSHATSPNIKYCLPVYVRLINVTYRARWLRKLRALFGKSFLETMITCGGSDISKQ